MPTYVGEVKGEELWIRCIFCGDSENTNHAHLAVNMTRGLYHCVRCEAAGHLSPRHMLTLWSNYLEDYQDRFRSVPDYREGIFLRSGQAAQMCPWLEWPIRPSTLERFHVMAPTSGYWDAFKIYDGKGSEVGLCLRKPGRSLIKGDGGIGYRGPLVSTPTSPLRLVEGPYDALTPQDVCCFGNISRLALGDLRGHCVLLCPDGDVWADPKKATRAVYTTRWALNNPRLFLTGIELLPPDKDPDEVPVEERVFLDRQETSAFLNQLEKVGSL